MLKTFRLVLVTEKASDGLQRFIRADQVFFKHEEKFIEAVADTLSDLKESRKKNLFCCDAIGEFHPLPENAKLFILMKVCEIGKKEEEMVSVSVKELRKIRSTAGGIQAMLSSGDINTNTVINNAFEIISRVDHLIR